MAKEVKWYDGCISLWHVIACQFVVCTLFPMTTVPSGNCTSVILLLITQGLIYTSFLCLVAIRAHFFPRVVCFFESAAPDGELKNPEAKMRHEARKNCCVGFTTSNL